jgi:hypothetical protein
MTFAEQRAADQRARARQVAYELAGKRSTRNIVAAILALVIADERRDIPYEPAPQPAAGARQILTVRPTQEALW